MSVEIVVVVPVLNRPERVAPLLESFESAKGVESALLFVCSPTDEDGYSTIRAAYANAVVAEWAPGQGDFARKQNLGAKAAGQLWPESKWIFAGADDLRFTPCWDVCALETAEETGASVIGTDDGWNPMVRRGEHSTHSLIRRVYIDAIGASWDGPGTVYSEAYDHQWVDNELVEIAKKRRAWAFSPGSLVEHLHPMAGKSQTDATYRKALAKGAEDHELFLRRRRQYG